MYKIACMGDRASIMGYAALGLETFSFETNETAAAAETLRRLATGGYGIIYITEALADKLQKEISRYDDVAIPAVILIPGVSGNTGKGLKDLAQSVEKAVGSNILEN